MVSTVDINNSTPSLAMTASQPAAATAPEMRSTTADKPVAAPVSYSSKAAPRNEPASQNSPSVDVAASYNQLQSSKESTNQIAQTVRQLNTVQKNVDDMRSKLSQIVKMYPPYPKDSSVRAELLSQVSGLRKLTDQLTIPPAYEAVVNNAQAASNVNASTSDVDVANALVSLNNASAAIAEVSRDLFASGYPEDASSIGAELAAQQRSVSAGQGLTGGGSGVSSEAGKSLAGLLAN